MNRAAGFTLIELMVVAAIAAILAAIAYSSYQDSVRKSRRQEAISTLLNTQLLQEKWRASNTSYTNNFTDLGGAPSNTYYTFTLPAGTATATAYTIRATAKSGTTQVNDKGRNSTSCSQIDVTQNGKSPVDCFN